MEELVKIGQDTCAASRAGRGGARTQKWNQSHPAPEATEPGPRPHLPQVHSDSAFKVLSKLLEIKKKVRKYHRKTQYTFPDYFNWKC